MTYTDTNGCACRLYRKFYQCMQDWLPSQPNCNSQVVTVVSEIFRRYILPFTTNYKCSITISRSTTAAFYSAFAFYHDACLKLI